LVVDELEWRFVEGVGVGESSHAGRRLLRVGG
jgi:hypothetical protein